MYNRGDCEGLMRLPILKGIALTIPIVSLLHGQWLNYPTARVPKTHSGVPNLDAPVPRAADGKPDLSGIWRAEKNRPCPPEGCVDMEVGQEFMNIGWSLKDGLPLQPWAADLLKKRMAENGKDDTTTHCLPQGVPRLHASPFLRK